LEEFFTPYVYLNFPLSIHVDMSSPNINATWTPVTMPVNVKQTLRFLIASSSVEAVHTGLQEILHEDYIFLRTLFSSAQARVTPAAAVHAVPAVPTQPPHVEPPLTAEPQQPQDITSDSRIRSDRKIRIVKKSGLTDLEVNSVSESPAAAPAPAQAAAHAPAEVNTSQPQPQDSPFTPFFNSVNPDKNINAEPKEDSKFRNPKDVKKWQKEQEELKHAELLKQGVDPKSLLTSANLKKWVELEGKPYAHIAREYVGLPEEFISAMAKSFGIQSVAAKRRAAVIAAQKRKAMP
jgi:hypothetical protein